MIDGRQLTGTLLAFDKVRAFSYAHCYISRQVALLNTNQNADSFFFV
jgi:hypothetical protein